MSVGDGVFELLASPTPMRYDDYGGDVSASRYTLPVAATTLNDYAAANPDVAAMAKAEALNAPISHYGTLCDAAAIERGKLMHANSYVRYCAHATRDAHNQFDPADTTLCCVNEYRRYVYRHKLAEHLLSNGLFEGRGRANCGSFAQTARGRMDGHDTTLQQHRQQLDAYGADLQAKSGQMAALSSRMQQLEERCARLEAEAKGTQAANATLTATVEQLKGENGHLRTQLDAATGRVQALNSKMIKLMSQWVGTCDAKYAEVNREHLEANGINGSEARFSDFLVRGAWKFDTAVHASEASYYRLQAVLDEMRAQTRASHERLDNLTNWWRDHRDTEYRTAPDIPDGFSPEWRISHYLTFGLFEGDRPWPTAARQKTVADLGKRVDALHTEVQVLMGEIRRRRPTSASPPALRRAR